MIISGEFQYRYLSLNSKCSWGISPVRPCLRSSRKRLHCTCINIRPTAYYWHMKINSFSICKQSHVSFLPLLEYNFLSFQPTFSLFYRSNCFFFSLIFNLVFLVSALWSVNCHLTKLIISASFDIDHRTKSSKRQQNAEGRRYSCYIILFHNN